MNRLSIMMFAAALAGSALCAQSSSVGELKTNYTTIKNNLMRAAEGVPEEDYSFKPTPEMRSLGALIGHIADAGTMYCSAAAGKPERVSSADKTSKADLMAALKASFDRCDAVFDSLTDAAAAEQVSMGRMGSRSKLGLLVAVVAHDNEEYGYLAVYLRLKGIVPPSSAPRK